jgi:quercetin dioxygenase-like cupin family protein
MGLKIEKHSRLENAQRSVMPREVEYSYIRHVLEDGEEVGIHIEKVDEYIFINNGKFILTVGNVNINFNLNGRNWLSICLPAGIKHALRAESELFYFVLKG